MIKINQRSHGNKMANFDGSWSQNKVGWNISQGQSKTNPTSHQPGKKRGQPLHLNKQSEDDKLIAKATDQHSTPRNAQNH